MKEGFKPTETNELSPSELARAEELLRDSNLPSDTEMFADYAIAEGGGQKDFADTEPDKLAWRDPVSSIMDYQVDAAKEILEGAPAKPATPGKTDEFVLPKIAVQPGTKPELAKPQPEQSYANNVRLDEKNSPTGREKQRMLEREANKNKKGFFARLFGG